MFRNYFVIFAVVIPFNGVSIRSESETEYVCDLRLRVEGGWVCGTQHEAYDRTYASFKGIPYAQQPIGELRFKELQPIKPWSNYLDATHEGPICPQYDEIYGRLVKPHRVMSEACIHVNVYIPMVASFKHKDQSNYLSHRNVNTTAGIPILVMIHGGGFQAGSDDSDLYGPEYLIRKGIIVITFNYRINVFGFLSMNTSNIPGNAALRDQVTLLRWVQRNAKAFGGNPNDVTLMGQSTGAACAHLLSLSKETRGLFQRVILMSGVGVRSFFSASPLYAQTVATLLFTNLGINSTDSDYIYQQLINMSLEKIMEANRKVQYETGLLSFTPVVESEFPGITRIIDDEPAALVQRGRGNEYPLIIGFNSNECEFFKSRVERLNVLERIKQNPILILPLSLAYSSLSNNIKIRISRKIRQRYFNGKPTYEKYLDVCADEFFLYPAFTFARWRTSVKSAPIYMYQLSYHSDFNSVKLALNLDHYKGTTHVEDITYVFKGISMLEDEMIPVKDKLMRNWMTTFITNFMRCNNPTCSVCNLSQWPPVQDQIINYQQIHMPDIYSNSQPTKKQLDMIKFYDGLWNARNKSLITRCRSSD